MKGALCDLAVALISNRGVVPANGISPSGMGSIATMLRRNTVLKTLDVSRASVVALNAPCWALW